MPIGARRAVAGVTVAAAAALLPALGAVPASAAPLDCTKLAEIPAPALDSCIGALRTQADDAAKAAEQADEAWLQSKQASQRARQRLADAAAAAERADATAVASRARAALVAANLARGGGSVGSTAQVLLSGDGAATKLYHLSRMSELGTDAGRLADDAARDQRLADAAHVDEARAGERVRDSERAAKTAYTTAKDESDDARSLVIRAEAERDPKAAAKDAKHAAVDLPPDASKADRVLAFARSQIGEPYVFGGAGPSTWDCSGLTMMALQAVGRSIGGHSSNAQYHLAAAKGLLVPYSQAKPGDLLFYGSGDYYHVAIYSGGGNMVEAPHPGASVREVPVRTGDLAPMVARFTG